MAGGRPEDDVISRLKDGWQARFLEMGADGCSDVEIRAEFGISTDLWYRWLDQDQQFSETAIKAKALCHAKWESMGRKMAFGQADGNPTTWIFNMKNRFGWRDKMESALVGADGGAVDINHTVTFVSAKKAES